MLNIFRKKKNDCTLYAPVNGRIKFLENVPDKVFASKMMGDGIAFEYEENLIYAPCDCKITLIANSLHAVGITCENGAEVLIHIGLDSVNLNGQGFKKLVNVGDKVKRGTPLIEINRNFMKEQNINLITPMIVTNGDDFELIIIKKVKDVTINDEMIICKKK